ncbi:MAG: hypothetical protein ACJA0N_001270 [Pseudohongiellaceae bacterium]|jgi:hypothetical protein
MGEDIVLCTDGNSIDQTFTENEHIPHKRIAGLNNGHVVDGISHIQNINIYISRLKNWMVRLNGVVTKYLENYLGWRRVIGNKRIIFSPKYYLRQALSANYPQLIPT